MNLSNRVLHYQLRELYPKIALLKKKTKEPQESWTKNYYDYRDPIVAKHLEQGGNIALICGHTFPHPLTKQRKFFLVIDCDQREVGEWVMQSLPRTFCVRSGSGGLHAYYTYSVPINKVPLTKWMPSGPVHFGDVQAERSLIVAPPSIHPNGQEYRVEVDEPIVELEPKQLSALLEIYSNATNDFQKVSEGKRHRKIVEPQVTASARKWLQGVVDGWEEKKPGEYQGAHPIHGSTTGKNTSIKVDTGEWYCHRCQSGGGILSAIAVFHLGKSCQEQGYGPGTQLEIGGDE